MFFNLLARLLGTNKRTLEFLIDTKKIFYIRLFILIPLTIWGTLLGLILPLFWKFLVDAINENQTTLLGINLGSTFYVLLAILGLYLLTNVVDRVVGHLKNVYLHKIKQDSEANLEDRFMQYLTKFDASFLGTENNLRIIRSLQWSFVYIQEAMIDLIISIISIPTKIVGLIFIIPFLHPFLIGVIILTTIITMWLDGVKSEYWRSSETMESRTKEQKNNLEYKAIDNFATLLSNGWINQLLNMYKVQRTKWFVIERKQFNRNERFGLLQEFVNLFFFGVTYVITGWLVTQKAISLGTSRL
jgi:ABC-type multidrug transport system fused ATPase/permease subunit